MKVEQSAPNQNEVKLLWSVKETCEMLGLGRTSVLALAYDGNLPSIKVGRRRMFSASKVKDWAASLPGAAPQTVDVIDHNIGIGMRRAWSKG